MVKETRLKRYRWFNLERKIKKDKTLEPAKSNVEKCKSLIGVYSNGKPISFHILRSRSSVHLKQLCALRIIYHNRFC